MVQRSHENMNLNKNKFKPRVNYADTAINRDTFLLHHLVHVIVLWQMKKFMCYCTFLLCFVLYLRRQFPRINPRVLEPQGRFYGGFFVLRVCGALIGGAYQGGANSDSFHFASHKYRVNT